jgi:hypothetical protein
VALLREIYADAYLASAENYRAPRAEVETPEKVALAYREFVRETVRRAVLDWKEFRRDEVMAMTTRAGIPEEERARVVDYIGQEFAGLHEGNVILYRLKVKACRFGSRAARHVSTTRSQAISYCAAPFRCDKR